MSSLVIVESSSKSKTIKNYLGDGYYVTFSAGHICDLPKDSLGINTDNWTATYQATNKKIIDNIRGLVRKCDKIYIASDPDIEGEAIAYHIRNSIKDLLKNKTCYRIKFNEITKRVILNAIQNPDDIDMLIVEGQETRRMADRLIGYKISPLLWKTFNNNFLSAGRVQIASLIICINQRNKILKKEIIPVWTIQGKFKANELELVADLMHDKNIWKTNDNADVMQQLEKLAIGTDYQVSYEQEVRNVFPYPPYTTTTMQQDAYNKLRMTSKTTMKIAQDLYEHGCITYMRTDSVVISEDSKHKIIDYVKRTYGDEKAKYRTYKTKTSNAQEAHEAVRITKPDLLSPSFEGCRSEHTRLYEMIWRRSIACMMADAEFADFKILLYDKDNRFRCTKSFLVEEGFYLAYEPKKTKEDYSEFEELLKQSVFKSKEFVSKGEVNDVPSMYNEVQLIKELEKEGIGRPSTYATTIDKLMSKKYVELGMNPQQSFEVACYKKTKSGLTTTQNTINLGGKQKDLLIPTGLGISIIEYIYKVADYLCDLKFTAKMEADMDEIMHQRASKSDILNVLYGKISETVRRVAQVAAAPATSDTQRNQGAEPKEIIHSRYGACYYDIATKKYTNIEPYLKWRKKTVETLDAKDIAFIKSLPKKIEKDSKAYHLHIGKYGLYLKDDAGNNVKLDKALWKSYL